MRRSLASSQRIVELVPALVQELHERGLEVAPVALPDEPLELARRAREQPLPVREHHELVRVAVGLLDVVRRVDDPGPGGGSTEDELPQARALARVERRAPLVE